MPNKLSQFWQELKRRKVTRVITVYAAASFVILQLVEILAPSLRLPDWTMNLILVLLIVGFIIAVILSWIYDVHPEEGIVKIKPDQKASEASAPPSSKGWRIASYISFVVIVGLIILNVIPRSSNRKVLEKSIAVLPLEYLSEDPNKEYLANGVLDAITGHLSMIEGLRVIPRTSVEQYRENKKSAKEIGEELDVSYLIEGSFLMVEDQVKLTIQLVVANEEDHVFFREYDRNYKDIFIVQSEVAQTIANEIEVVITPKEKQLIGKIPTTDLTAYDFYQRGREEHWKFKSNNDSKGALERAEDLYHKALEFDPTFAQAYSGLANVYWDKHFWETYFQVHFLDSVIILSNIALSLDDQLAEAYTIRGNYYREKGLAEQAIIEYDNAIKFNPNDWEAYYGKGQLYRFEDVIKTLENLQKAVSLNQGAELPALLEAIGWAYYYNGFIEKGNSYVQKAFKLDGDSMRYYYSLSIGEWNRGNYAKTIEFGEKVYAIDKEDIQNLNRLGESHMYLGQYEESLSYYKESIERSYALGHPPINSMHRIGYVYWQNGYKNESDSCFNKQLNYCNMMIELGRRHTQQLLTYYDLAGVYAFKGEKDKAYRNLRIFNQKERTQLWMVILIKDDPLFDSIRDEPEFQQIVRDVESKYQAEHERIRQWLEENDML